MSNNEGEILIYEGKDESIEVRLDTQQETLWLTQKQMSEVFITTPENILMHLKNIYSASELIERATTKNFLVVRTEGKRQVKRKLKHYDLDAIISVGYRVNSRRAVQFRQWATARLKDYLVQGYALNKQRLTQHQEQLKKLEQTLSLFQQNLIDQASLPEAQGLVKVIADYANTFVLLNQFDSERLPLNDFDENIRYQIEYDEAKAAIALLVENLMVKGEATELVGNEKDDSFSGILGSIVQSFGGEYLYPSIEAQAAHLLYFIIKNHPFNDGNKRIGHLYLSGFYSVTNTI